MCFGDDVVIGIGCGSLKLIDSTCGRKSSRRGSSSSSERPWCCFWYYCGCGWLRGSADLLVVVLLLMPLVLLALFFAARDAVGCGDVFGAGADQQRDGDGLWGEGRNSVTMTSALAHA